MKSMLASAGLRHPIVDDVRTSLWFLPSLMALGGAILFSIAQWGFDNLDAYGAAWWIYVGSPEEARSVLSTLLTSMITMTSLVFSITMVVLTLAARQFGPRLVRNFMGSLHTQVVLGTFMMTIVFVLMALPTAGARDDAPMSSFPVVNLALALTLISVLLLIPFMHSLAKSIVSETVIEQVGAELDDLLGELPRGESDRGDPRDALPDHFEARSTAAGPRRSGYVQAVQFEKLVAIAEARDLVIGLYFRPGDYLVKDASGIALYPAERVDERTMTDVRNALVIGGRRTPAQDPEYAIRHLVEIAVRSLSPSTNDPYTAVAVINRLSASLCSLMKRSLPPSVFKDLSGATRVVCPQPSYASLLRASFDQIRQHGADKPIIAIYLLEAVRRIAEHAVLPQQLASLSEHVDALEASARRRLMHGSDLVTVEDRIASTRRMLQTAREMAAFGPRRSERPAGKQEA